VRSFRVPVQHAPGGPVPPVRRGEWGGCRGHAVLPGDQEAGRKEHGVKCGDGRWGKDHCYNV